MHAGLTAFMQSVYRPVSRWYPLLYQHDITRKRVRQVDGYSVSESAKLLKVTRQTVYKYVNRDKERYTLTTDAGQRQVTLQGLEFLRSDIERSRASVNRQGAERSLTMRQDALTNVTELQRRLRAAEDRAALLEQENSRLSARIEILTAQKESDKLVISELQSSKAATERALIQAQELHLRAIMRPRESWIKRLFGKTETDRGQGDQVKRGGAQNADIH